MSRRKMMDNKRKRKRKGRVQLANLVRQERKPKQMKIPLTFPEIRFLCNGRKPLLWSAGLMEVDMSGGTLTVEYYSGRTNGSTIKDSVDRDLRALNLPPVGLLKTVFTVVKESGSPDYYYFLQLDTKRKEKHDTKAGTKVVECLPY